MEIAFVYPVENKSVVKARWAEHACLDLGHRTRHVSCIDGLKRADRECDLVLFDHRNAGLNKNAIREIGRRKQTLWFQWWRDLIVRDPSLPLSEQGDIRVFGPMMRVMDRVFVKEASYLDEYRALGINAYYLDQGCPTEFWANGDANEVRRNYVSGLVNAIRERL